MVLSFFDRFPSEKTLKRNLVIAFFFFIVLMMSVNIAFDQSQYPVSFMESQLSFSGETIKSHYETMSADEIQLYIYAQVVDFGYMLAYGSFILILGVYLGRLQKQGSIGRNISYVIGLMGVTAMICDMIENVFILLMAQNPLGFPNWYAIIHSIFASIKFALLGGALLGVIILILLIFYKRFQKMQSS
jgi:hypothetical protein